MDEFAQTRGVDNLFEDEFTPVPEPVTKASERQSNVSQRTDQNYRTTARGRGNRYTRDNPRQSPAQPPVYDNTPAQRLDTSAEQNEAPSNPIEHATTPTQQPKTSTAVRGDRTATGGVTKPKLTEDELSARLAAAKLNNAKRAEAHRLAEADEASFQKREAQASQKRKEEGAARRAMNMERERNRLRKLGAQSGREWDEGKEEQIASQDRGSQYRRGAQGGVLYQAGRQQSGYQNGVHNPDFQERRGRYGPRGGRGRGDRGNSGRGRGSFHSNSNKNTPQVAPNPDTDFPALPIAPRRTEISQSQQSDRVREPLGLAIEGENSWADEVQEAKSPEG